MNIIMAETLLTSHLIKLIASEPSSFKRYVSLAFHSLATLFSIEKIILYGYDQKHRHLEIIEGNFRPKNMFKLSYEVSHAVYQKFADVG